MEDHNGKDDDPDRWLFYNSKDGMWHISLTDHKNANDGVTCMYSAQSKSPLPTDVGNWILASRHGEQFSIDTKVFVTAALPAAWMAKTDVEHQGSDVLDEAVPTSDGATDQAAGMARADVEHQDRDVANEAAPTSDGGTLNESSWTLLFEGVLSDIPDSDEWNMVEIYDLE